MPTCPNNPAPPAGYAVWTKPVPQALSTWAVRLVRSAEFQGAPYWTTWETTAPDGGQVLARKDYHTWTHDSAGQLVTGVCISGVTLYMPLTDRAVPPPGTIEDEPRPNAGLILASASAAATVVGLFLIGLHYAGKG